MLRNTTDIVEYQQKLIVCGDCNGHIGLGQRNLENIKVAFRVGDRKAEGERVIDYALVNDFSIINMFYRHRESCKWTYSV